MFCIVLLAKVLLLLVYDNHVTPTQASCNGYETEVKLGKALAGHVMKTISLNDVRCNDMCFAMLNCFSINHYVNESDGRDMCQLNKASRRVVPGSLVSKAGYSYIEITKCLGDGCEDQSENSYTPLAYWTLDGTDDDVRLKGDAKYQNDGGRNVLYLNGTDSWAETPAVDFRRSSFTMACWIKILAPPEKNVLIYSDWSQPHQFKLLYEYTNKKLTFQTRNAAKKDAWLIQASFVVEFLGRWVHVASSVNRESRQGKLFLDGKEASLAPPRQSDINLVENNHEVYDIGLKRDSGERTFKGFVKDLVIFRRALEEDEVAAFKDMPPHMLPWKLQISRNGHGAREP